MTAAGRDAGPIDDDAEVAGRAVAALREAVADFPADDRERAERILTAHGLDDAAPDSWYPVCEVADAFAALADEIGRYQVRELGGDLVRRLGSSDGIETAADALAALDDGYRRYHRGDAGRYDFRQIGATDGRVECVTPYPCALDQGVVQGAADAFSGEFVRLSEVGSCSDDADGRCTYEVTW